jgi:hypothetical protein
MGFLDKAKDLVGENRDKIRQGIDMAEKQARKYVPAQHSSKLAKAADMAHKGVDKVDAPAPTSAETPNHSDEHDGVTDPPGGDTGE